MFYVFRIFAAWFVFGLASGAALIWLLRPLAGLFFFITTMTAATMFAAPLLHVLLVRVPRRRPLASNAGAIVMVATCLVGLLFALLVSGRFNFT